VYGEWEVESRPLPGGMQDDNDSNAIANR